MERYIYIHAYIHTYIHTHIYIYIYIYVHIHIHTYTHTYIYSYIHMGSVLRGQYGRFENSGAQVYYLSLQVLEREGQFCRGNQLMYPAVVD